MMEVEVRVMTFEDEQRGCNQEIQDASKAKKKGEEIDSSREIPEGISFADTLNLDP